MSRASKQAENMWNEILAAAGFSDKRSIFSRDTLLDLAKAERPGTLKHIAWRFEEKGRSINWNVVQPSFLLDECFAVDSLTDPQGQGELYSFDVTLNAPKVSQKEEKLARLGNCYKQLGITKSAVILITWVDGPKSFSTLDPDVQEDLIDRAYNMVGQMHDSKGKVFNFSLSI
jgi:hypothetical protein